MRQLGIDIRKYLNGTERKKFLCQKSINPLVCLVLKKSYEADILSTQKSLRQRIIEVHLNMLTKRFCDTMCRYHDSVIKYRETCKTIVIRQLQLGLLFFLTDENICFKF